MAKKQETSTAILQSNIEYGKIAGKPIGAFLDLLHKKNTGIDRLPWNPLIHPSPGSRVNRWYQTELMGQAIMACAFVLTTKARVTPGMRLAIAGQLLYEIGALQFNGGTLKDLDHVKYQDYIGNAGFRVKAIERGNHKGFIVTSGKTAATKSIEKNLLVAMLQAEDAGDSVIAAVRATSNGAIKAEMHETLEAEAAERRAKRGKSTRTSLNVDLKNSEDDQKVVDLILKYPNARVISMIENVLKARKPLGDAFVRKTAVKTTRKVDVPATAKASATA